MKLLLALSVFAISLNSMAGACLVDMKMDGIPKSCGEYKTQHDFLMAYGALKKTATFGARTGWPKF